MNNGIALFCPRKSSANNIFVPFTAKNFLLQHYQLSDIRRLKMSLESVKCVIVKDRNYFAHLKVS